MRLREDPETHRMEFPANLTNTERKFIHELASKLGLVSKSSGKGENRRIAVTKRSEGVRRGEGSSKDENEIPTLRLGDKGRDALKRHIAKFPPSDVELMESRETGAALLARLQEAAGTDVGNTDQNDEVALDSSRMNQILEEMVGESDKQAPKFERKVRSVDLEKRKQQHAVIQKRKRASSAYRAMQQNVRSKLPASAQERLIVDTVASNPITIIQGETGSGKSTQVPQFILDANPTCSIVCTQPRRISCISIAERVNQEQCSGESVGNMIGYNIRLESKATAATQLLFVTPGILLRRLSSDPSLSQFSHVIIDEIHEKDKYTEFLLITLRDLIPMRPGLRLILMSATLQTSLLLDYFSSTAGVPEPAVVKVEGRTFPVQPFFLEDILRMTGYVDHAIDGDDGGSNDQVATSASASFTCRKCGKSDFPDGIEFGIHELLCNGRSAKTEKEIDDDEAGDVINWFEDPDLEGGEDEEHMMDYDVGETMGQDYENNSESSRGQATSEDDEEEEDKGKKWDGISPYSVQPTSSSINAKDEDLLNSYQTMHDDDTADMNLLMEILHYIIKSSSKDGAILVFLPGWQEISEFKLMLESAAPFSNRSKFLCLPLHSGIPSRDQRAVLRVPPPGVRKIVLSTNIAETSLTIEDVAFVVDSGRAKEKSYDPHLKTSTLHETWISQASSKQRRGRAGRTKAGVCFHLFSSRRFASMDEFTASELLRTPLEEMALHCKRLDLAPGGPEDDDGIPAFLSKAMSPPHPKSVVNALNNLVELGAMLPDSNNLTHLGKCLATLSVEPRVGKMVIWSYLLGCSRAASDMAVAMSYKTPFSLPPPHLRRAADERKAKLSNNSESDQITVMHVLQKRDSLSKHSAADWSKFCRDNFLSHSSIQMISDLRRNLAREIESLGFPSLLAAYNNRHNKDGALWQAAIAAGLYPNVASRSRGEVNFKTVTNQKCRIHTSSVNALKGCPLNSKSQVPKGETEFVCFGEMVKGSFFFTLNNTTHLASPLPLILLCGASLSVMPLVDDASMSTLNVDDWILFRTDRDLASHLAIFRKRLEAAFWRIVANPSSLKTSHSEGKEGLSPEEQHAIEILGSLLQSAHQSTIVR